MPYLAAPFSPTEAGQIRAWHPFRRLHCAIAPIAVTSAEDRQDEKSFL